MKAYQHILVGTGQATGTLLGKLIPTGESIAVIEGHKVGGSCVNYGCTPTKSLVASARAIHQARRGDIFGFSVNEISVDFPAVMKRMNDIREASNEGLTDWMDSSENVDLIRGWASFAAEKELLINDQRIKGERIYLNVGTRIAAPPIEGLDQVPWMDSEELLALEKLPAHLIIVGGGYIGVEFAQIFQRLGSEVTLIQRGSQLMPQEDEDVATSITSFLQKEGISVLLEAGAKKAEKTPNGIRLMIEMEGSNQQLAGSHLLIATGRKPNNERLNLEKAGITTTKRGYIEVDDYCQTNVSDVFAVGDANGKGAFTHTAVNDAEIVLDHLQEGNRKISDRLPIYALFTDPPLGRVGLSEKEAIAKGYNVLMSKKPMSEISRAKEMSETIGFAKLLVDADTDQILGAAVLGPGGDEIINMFAAIMHSKIPCKKYREVVLVHPTVSELMPFVLDGLAPV